MAFSRKDIIQRINEGFAENNLEKVLSYCTDDFAWTMVGESTVRGKDAIRTWMASMDPQPPQFTIRRTVAEGDVVITQGDMVMPEKKNGAPIPYSFCDVYRFTGDKVAELNAFVIRTDKAGRRETAPAESERLSTAR
jgi:uncharacterized protein